LAQTPFEPHLLHRLKGPLLMAVSLCVDQAAASVP